MTNQYGNICTCVRCNGIVHTIRRGDTLYLLSRRYNVSVNDIMNANRNVNIYNLRIGDRLCIPSMIQPRMNEDADRVSDIREDIIEEIMDEYTDDVEDIIENMEVSQNDIKEEFVIDENMRLSDVVAMENMTLHEFAKVLREIDK